jgi:hypothetical protein
MTSGQRKCAMLLLSLRDRDSRYLLSRLPAASARAVGKLVAELKTMCFPVEMAEELLADNLLGLTPGNSLDVEQLVDLSRRLSPEWFARVLSVWTGVDHKFCISLLDAGMAKQVSMEMSGLKTLPPKLSDAIKVEALALVRKEAA